MREGEFILEMGPAPPDFSSSPSSSSSSSSKRKLKFALVSSPSNSLASISFSFSSFIPSNPTSNAFETFFSATSSVFSAYDRGTSTY